MSEAQRAGLQALYPFLADDRATEPVGSATQRHDVLATLTESVAQKALEIVGLRRAMVEDYGDQLAACATPIATRGRRGGRLFTFGNGGSSCDAQQVADDLPAPAARLAGARDVADQRRRSADRAGQRRRLRPGLRPAARRAGQGRRCRLRPVRQRRLRQRAARPARGAPARHAHRRSGRLRRRGDGRAPAWSTSCSSSRPPRSIASRRSRRPSTTCSGISPSGSW